MKVIRVIKLMLNWFFAWNKSLILNRFNAPIFNVEDSIKPNIIGVDTFMKTLKNLVLLILFMNIAISSIIINDGKITPDVAIIAPSNPLVEYPRNVAILIANGPGVDSEMAIKLENV